MGHYRIIKAPWGAFNVWGSTLAHADFLQKVCATEAEAKAHVEALHAEDAARAGLKPCRFTFSDCEGPSDTPVYDGFSHGAVWNGWDNVSVTPAVRDQILADWAAQGGVSHADEEAILDALATQPADKVGLIDLSGGWTITIEPDPAELRAKAEHMRTLLTDHFIEIADARLAALYDAIRAA